MTRATKLWIGLGVLIALTPLGLLARGGAWGEWTSDELETRAGCIPEGVQRLEHLWHAVLRGYDVHGWPRSAGYLLSASLGVLMIATITWMIGAILIKKRGRHRDP